MNNAINKAIMWVCIRVLGCVCVLNWLAGRIEVQTVPVRVPTASPDHPLGR